VIVRDHLWDRINDWIAQFSFGQVNSKVISIDHIPIFSQIQRGNYLASSS
jgi:hypothetical protein